MLQGLSRKSLNIIILVCLVVITWLNLAGGEDQEPPLEPLALPPLHAAAIAFPLGATSADAFVS